MEMVTVYHHCCLRSRYHGNIRPLVHHNVYITKTIPLRTQLTSEGWLAEISVIVSQHHPTHCCCHRKLGSEWHIWWCVWIFLHFWCSVMRSKVPSYFIILSLCCLTWLWTCSGLFLLTCCRLLEQIVRGYPHLAQRESVISIKTVGMQSDVDSCRWSMYLLVLAVYSVAYFCTKFMQLVEVCWCACLLQLASEVYPVCPVCTLPHLRGMWYVPNMFCPRSFTSWPVRVSS